MLERRSVLKSIARIVAVAVVASAGIKLTQEQNTPEAQAAMPLPLNVDILADNTALLLPPPINQNWNAPEAQATNQEWHLSYTERPVPYPKVFDHPEYAGYRPEGQNLAMVAAIQDEEGVVSVNSSVVHPVPAVYIVVVGGTVSLAQSAKALLK